MSVVAQDLRRAWGHYRAVWGDAWRRTMRGLPSVLVRVAWGTAVSVLGLLGTYAATQAGALPPPTSGEEFALRVVISSIAPLVALLVLRVSIPLLFGLVVGASRLQLAQRRAHECEVKRLNEETSKLGVEMDRVRSDGATALGKLERESNRQIRDLEARIKALTTRRLSVVFDADDQTGETIRRTDDATWYALAVTNTSYEVTALACYGQVVRYRRLDAPADPSHPLPTRGHRFIWTTHGGNLTTSRPVGPRSTNYLDIAATFPRSPEYATPLLVRDQYGYVCQQGQGTYEAIVEIGSEGEGQSFPPTRVRVLFNYGGGNDMGITVMEVDDPTPAAPPPAREPG